MELLTAYIYTQADEVASNLLTITPGELVINRYAYHGRELLLATWHALVKCRCVYICVTVYNVLRCSQLLTKQYALLACVVE